MTRRDVRRIALVMWLLLAVTANVAWAQKPLDQTISTNPAIISVQLRQAMTAGEAALVRLNSFAADEPSPQTMKLLEQSYALIRAARSGMEESRSGKKYADPILDLQFKWTTDAWHFARRPLDNATSAIPREEYITRCINDVTTALSKIRQVQAFLP